MISTANSLVQHLGAPFQEAATLCVKHIGDAKPEQISIAIASFAFLPDTTPRKLFLFAAQYFQAPVSLHAIQHRHH
jgi:hypothetical protein